MISANKTKIYCVDDISLIENYHQAVWDPYEKWEIHHRRECDEEGRTLFTGKQLIEMKLYYKRPASELIFVTRSMHWKMHREHIQKMAKIGGKIGGGSEAAKEALKEKLSIPILQFSKDGTLVKEWQSAMEAQRQLGISCSGICKCCKGKSKSAGGFIWKYKT